MADVPELSERDVRDSERIVGQMGTEPFAKALDAGAAPAWSPLVLALFNLAYLVLAYPAGRWSDRVAPRTVLLWGIALLVAADLWLARATSLAAVAGGVLLWGAHMALTQGVFSRMVAAAASEELTARERRVV